MSRFVVSLLVTLGAAAWIYNKLQRNTGNNTQSSLIATAVIALVVFIVFFFASGTILK